MFKHHELANRISDAAGLLSYAEESFEKLTALTAAIAELADKPEICHSLARLASDMAEKLADSFGGFTHEYDSEYRCFLNNEQSSQGNA
ncbi:hypothetical protein [Paraburkholderia rhizosphaerae]|uniref:Uncharacterized protein n=1 Tax=Paraburkholderia rhizosphaerae TaxID=480658 RepID=A0A4R8LMF2_9BURK|nr:hypothetical protein [Paraburkholderia rhizosphaerae]TDY46475.1 hypothetical protein BX592_113103 [Paraburkholderia rhizosphaerae]